MSHDKVFILLLIVFDYSIVLLSSSLGGNIFTKGGKARLQQAAEDRKHYPDFEAKFDFS